MKQIEDVAVLIQARLGSQRVPQKMIRPFAGTTLLDIALEKIRRSRIIHPDRFFLSVYEPELRDIGKKHGVQLFDRSEKSAKSEGTPMTDMYDWWDKLDHTYGVLINACAPFLSIETIDGFIEHYLKTRSDGLFGVMPKKNYFWNAEKQLITPWPEDQAVMNTKAVGVTYEAAHCLYAGRLSRIGDGVWMGDFSNPGDIDLYEVDEFESFDVDYEWQFNVAEKLTERKT